MYLIAANWKMNKTIGETKEYLDKFLPEAERFKDKVEIMIAPPYTSLCVASDYLKDSFVKLGSQNMFYEKRGAYTGEISPLMLKELGVDYVIIGHSERRYILGERDEIINKKLISAIENDIRPILCVGETLEEREQGLTYKVLEKQIRNGLAGIENEVSMIDIAYEPVWAIGTGVSATPEDANNSHKFIRELINDLSHGRADNTRILYGGSVKPENAEALINEEFVDGFLIGTASLQPESFLSVLEKVVK
jgi:triosephosphate isomerase